MNFQPDLDCRWTSSSNSRCFFASGRSCGVPRWCGYRLKSDLSCKDRASLISEIKGLGYGLVGQDWLNGAIRSSLKILDKLVGLSSFDFFVFPVSGRSRLVETIMYQVKAVSEIDEKQAFVPLVKNIPLHVEFDRKAFANRFGPDGLALPSQHAEVNRYRQMRGHVKEVLIPRIRTQSYFSLARDTKPKYRPFFYNYLFFDVSDSEKLENYCRLRDSQGATVLIVDDVATTGSTLNEIIRITNGLNPSLNLCAYTLFGA